VKGIRFPAEPRKLRGSVSLEASEKVAAANNVTGSLTFQALANHLTDELLSLRKTIFSQTSAALD
jgi:hypothetical protein